MKIEAAMQPNTATYLFRFFFLFLSLSSFLFFLWQSRQC
jgi:hypothetical protein